MKVSNTNQKRIFASLMILFVFALSVNALAIGKNNPIASAEQQSYSGTIVAVDGQFFDFTVDDVLYQVHVPQYVDVSDLSIEIDQLVDVTGYVKTTSTGVLIYPTVINGITLEDLKPLDGTGKL